MEDNCIFLKLWRGEEDKKNCFFLNRLTDSNEQYICCGNQRDNFQEKLKNNLSKK